MFRELGCAMILCAVAIVWSTTAFAEEQQSYWNATDWYVVFEREEDGQLIGHFYERDSSLPGFLFVTDEWLDGGLLMYWSPFPRSDFPPNRVCDEKKLGHDYWGLAVIEPDGPDRFTGYRTECDDSASERIPFDGVLASGQPWWVAPSEPKLELRHPELDVLRKQAIAASNAATPNPVPDKDVQELILDYDCDGGLDYVLGWLDADHPEGPHYEMTVTRWQARPGDARPELRAFWYRISFQPHHEPHLCIADSQPGGITIEQLKVTPEVRDRYGLNDFHGNCQNAIVVRNGVCPAVLYYWSRDYRYSVSTTLE